MIVVIVPGMLGLIRVPVVIDEEADGLAPIGPDHDLSCSPTSHTLSFLSTSTISNPGAGLPMEAGWSRINPQVIGDADHRLRLPKALHEPQAGGFQEPLIRPMG